MNSSQPSTAFDLPTQPHTLQNPSGFAPGSGPLGRYHLKRPESYSPEQLHLLASLYYSHGWQQETLAQLFKLFRRRRFPAC